MLRRERWMMVALPTAAIMGVITVVVGGILIWRVLAHYVFALEGPLKAAPTQPIAYYHTVHAGDLQIQCQFCHRNASVGAPASVPAVEQCMFCHRWVLEYSGDQALNDEIAKLVEHYETGTPINWVRVHRLPDHVQFVHEPHIRRGVDCAVCHGDIAQMERVQQVRSLKMGDCVDCHRQYEAPTDCAVCHY